MNKSLNKPRRIIMKNLKKLSLLLAALTVSSALAATASAAQVFKGEAPAANSYCTVCGAIFEHDCKTETGKTTSGGNTVYTDATLPKNNGFIFSSSAVVTKPAKPVLKDPCNKPTLKPSINGIFGCDLIGGKFITPEDAEELLEEYFEENNYDLYLYEGESQALCEGAYFYSTDKDVVYYDYKTDKLVAKGYGCAEVYAYTAGGIPFFRMDVTVYRKSPSVKPVTLNIIPESWNISSDETTTFTVTASDGKTYDDIIYTLWHGSDIAAVSQTTGKLTAYENGAVVVHAYSKSNPNVNGDALVYIGKIAGAVADGNWKYCDGGIHVDSWKDDICDYYYTSKNICGWLKSAEGILIPVIKFEEATVNKGGEEVETTILTGGKYSLADLIKEAYGDKDKIAALITKYNLSKYGICTEKDCYKYLDCWMKGETYTSSSYFGVADPSDVLSVIIGGILG